MVSLYPCLDKTSVCSANICYGTISIVFLDGNKKMLRVFLVRDQKITEEMVMMHTHAELFLLCVE